MYRRLLSIAFCTASLDISLAAQPRPFVTQKDLGRWESLGVTRLSPDGTWLAYGIARGNEENELRIRSGARDSTIVIPYGQSPTFSADSRWLAYLVECGTKGARSAAQGEEAGAQRHSALRNLSTGRDRSRIPDVSAFSLQPVGRLRGGDASTRPKERRRPTCWCSISQPGHAGRSATCWSRRGATRSRCWRITVDGRRRRGKRRAAVRRRDRGGARARVVRRRCIAASAWRPKSDDLAVLRSEVRQGVRGHRACRSSPGRRRASSTTPRTARCGYRSRHSRGHAHRRLSPSDVVARWPHAVLRRAASASRWPTRRRRATEKVSDVEIWHTNDVRVIPEQRSAEQRTCAPRCSRHGTWQTARVVQIGSDPAEVDRRCWRATRTRRRSTASHTRWGRSSADPIRTSGR